MADNTPSLLGIPPELRDQIFGEVFKGDKRPGENRLKIDTSILSVNRQLNREGNEAMRRQVSPVKLRTDQPRAFAAFVRQNSVAVLNSWPSLPSGHRDPLHNFRGYVLDVDISATEPSEDGQGFYLLSGRDGESFARFVEAFQRGSVLPPMDLLRKNARIFTVVFDQTFGVQLLQRIGTTWNGFRQFWALNVDDEQVRNRVESQVRRDNWVQPQQLLTQIQAHKTSGDTAHSAGNLQQALSDYKRGADLSDFSTQTDQINELMVAGGQQFYGDFNTLSFSLHQHVMSKAVEMAKSFNFTQQERLDFARTALHSFEVTQVPRRWARSGDPEIHFNLEWEPTADDKFQVYFLAAAAELVQSECRTRAEAHHKLLDLMHATSCHLDATDLQPNLANITLQWAALTTAVMDFMDACRQDYGENSSIYREADALLAQLM